MHLSDQILRVAISGLHYQRMSNHRPLPHEWKRPPWRYLVLYLDVVTAPILSIIIALAIIGLRSLFR